MSQNNTMARRESLKFKTVLSSIGTVILKVCESPESVTEKWNGLGRVCVCVGMCVRACVCVSITLVHTCVCIYDCLRLSLFLTSNFLLLTSNF